MDHTDLSFITRPATTAIAIRYQALEPFTRWDGTDLIKLPVLIKTKGTTSPLLRITRL